MSKPATRPHFHVRLVDAARGDGADDGLEEAAGVRTAARELVHFHRPLLVQRQPMAALRVPGRPQVVVHLPHDPLADAPREAEVGEWAAGRLAEAVVEGNQQRGAITKLRECVEKRRAQQSSLAALESARREFHLGSPLVRFLHSIDQMNALTAYLRQFQQ